MGGIFWKQSNSSISTIISSTSRRIRVLKRQHQDDFQFVRKVMDTISFMIFVTNTQKQKIPFSMSSSGLAGNLDYFRRCVEMSEALSYQDNARMKLTLAPDYKVVFGGDICDKGIGDIRIMQQLVVLKDMYPTQVHLVMGNRDINKLRMSTELTEEAINTKEMVIF